MKDKLRMNFDVKFNSISLSSKKQTFFVVELSIKWFKCINQVPKLCRDAKRWHREEYHKKGQHWNKL